MDRSGVEGLAAGTPAPLLRAAPAVLEDMAVAVADAVAASYLSEAGFGLDGTPGANTLCLEFHYRSCSCCDGFPLPA